MQRYGVSILIIQCARMKCVGPNCWSNVFTGQSCKILKIKMAPNSKFVSIHKKWYLAFYFYFIPLDRISTKHLRGQQALIPFAEAEGRAVTVPLRSRSWTAASLVHASFWVHVSSKHQSEGEEGLTSSMVGAGHAASSTFLLAAAAAGWGGHGYSLTRSNDRSCGCRDNRAFNQDRLTKLTSSQLFPLFRQRQRIPLVGASSRALGEVSACITWGHLSL